MARMNSLITKLLLELDQRQEGMHLSEVADFLKLSHEDEVTTLASVGAKDGLRMDKGQYCYLLAWGKSRRISTMEAAVNTLKENLSGMSKSELQVSVEQIIRRPLDRAILSSILQNSDEVIFDAANGLWKYASETAAD